ncbi:glycosyltransferase [Pseudoalteromonas sp. CST5]|uniref:glycosyltransferase n=1 Tax=unclassified Pseudoalteromonas TaxID=194690 RepID=UPI00235851C2|nr:MULTISPECIES: glycosyltransferase [unclassified Pseudoalteromonas]MDC9514542.1 glycosyltransferase [Pseudoalteromonas sp. CST1]MDC9539013.1 glycosyltransferase [Pseudoalteromonas sp. CST3]MDC9541807.1 glycosyltransferase [Pseudoalteromonas sp. CST2]MDC9547245.1 glycosyltransferase [Pseudoalteromonas sp. CST4]MDC9550714.1 glycosyltransferase [Pseudoalteromonas sp. CST5]
MKVLAFPAFKNKKSNPYNYLLYTGMKGADVSEFSFSEALKLNYDVIHIHWPEWYLNSNFLIKAFFYSFTLIFVLSYAKLFGKKIIWTVHNLKPHKVKYKVLNRVFWKLYIPLVDGIVSLSNTNEIVATEHFALPKKIKKTVVYHGLYSKIYENESSKYEARNKLGICEDKRVFLFLGQIKKYKNLTELINVFNESDKLKNDVLLIAGKFESESYYQEVLTLKGSNENIIIYNKFIEDSDLQYFFNASDLSILPFKEIFNSGSALLSITFNTPVILPESNNFLEYGELFNKSIIHTYKNKITADFIIEASDLYHLYFKKGGKYELPEKLDWSISQNKLVEFYFEVKQVKKL